MAGVAADAPQDGRSARAGHGGNAAGSLGPAVADLADGGASGSGLAGSHPVAGAFCPLPVSAAISVCGVHRGG